MLMVIYYSTCGIAKLLAITNVAYKIYFAKTEVRYATLDMKMHRIQRRYLLSNQVNTLYVLSSTHIFIINLIN